MIFIVSYWNIIRIWKFAVPLVPVDEDFSFDFEDNELVEELTDSEAENVEGEAAVTGAAATVFFPIP